MKFYRNLLETGDVEYARIHDEADRADYFDEEFRVWISCDELWDEIAQDGTWTPVSEHEVDDATVAWPGSTGFDIGRVLA